MRTCAGLTRRMFTAMLSATVLIGWTHGGGQPPSFLLLEDGTHLLLEDGSKLILG